MQAPGTDVGSNSSRTITHGGDGVWAYTVSASKGSGLIRGHVIAGLLVPPPWRAIKVHHSHSDRISAKPYTLINEAMR